VLPLAQDSAFITTHFGLRQAFGIARTQDATVGTGKFSLAITSIQEALDFGVGISDWVGFYAHGVASVVVGTDAPSIYVRGVNASFGGEGGMAFGVYRSDRFRLTARVGAGGSAGPRPTEWGSRQWVHHERIRLRFLSREH
jgi:hypothetical protein